MEPVVIIFVCAIFLATSPSHSAKFPESFQKCAYRSANFNECLKKAIQNAIPQLTRPLKEVGLPSLKPLKIASLIIDPGSGPVNVKQIYKDISVYGFDSLKIQKADLNFDKKTVLFEAWIPNIRFEGEYSLNGQVLLLPIVGSGQSTILMQDIDVSIFLSFEEVKKKGETYLQFSMTKTEINPKKIRFNFENLFNGDKILGDNINEVINEAWKEIYEDVRGQYEDFIGTIAKDTINQFFSRIPVKEVFENYS